MILLTPSIITSLLWLKLRKKHKKFTNKHFSDYLANENVMQYFCNQPSDKEKITNIISSLKPIKASGPDSTSCKNFFLLKNEIS